MSEATVTVAVNTANTPENVTPANFPATNATPATPEKVYTLDDLTLACELEDSLKDRYFELRKEITAQQDKIVKIASALVATNPALKGMIRRLIGNSGKHEDGGKKRGRPAGSKNKAK